MSCQKIKCRFQELGNKNDCTRSEKMSGMCINNGSYPLFQLKLELMRKAAKKPSRIYNP